MPLKASTPGWPILLSTSLALALHAAVLPVDVFQRTQPPTVSGKADKTAVVHVRDMRHDATESARPEQRHASAYKPVFFAPVGRQPRPARPASHVHGIEEDAAPRTSLSTNAVGADIEPTAVPGSNEPQDAYAGFLPAERLETVPRPYTAPDLSALTGRVRSGLPVMVTLLIAVDGTVREVVPDHALLTVDQKWFESIRETFLATRFTPGRLGGTDVAARLQVSVEQESADLMD